MFDCGPSFMQVYQFSFALSVFFVSSNSASHLTCNTLPFPRAWSIANGTDSLSVKDFMLSVRHLATPAEPPLHELLHEHPMFELRASSPICPTLPIPTGGCGIRRIWRFPVP